MDERILDTTNGGGDDHKAEVLLRPQGFDEYIGQSRVVENISLMVESAKIREQAMDHALLSGPPGLGKTSLAMIISKALSTNLHVVSGPALEKKGDLASLLTNLQPHDEEILYSAMEDFKLDIVLGEGPAARTMQIDIHPFTLIGATTRSGLLSNPLRDRFIAHLHFDFYQASELENIVSNNAQKLSIQVDEKARLAIAQCSRGTPRIANRILRRVRDFALVYKAPVVTTEIVEKALELMDIDPEGLDRMDRRILTVMHEYYNGGPVGIDALCATLSEDRSTVEDVYEPYLLKEGYIIRTPRGRELSEKSRQHLGVTYNHRSAKPDLDI